MENSSNYTPIDLSQIKRFKASSEKDFENEVNKIVDMLKDTCKYQSLFQAFNFENYLETHDWKKRTDCLKKIQEIAVLYDDVVSQSSHISY